MVSDVSATFVARTTLRTLSGVFWKHYVRSREKAHQLLLLPRKGRVEREHEQLLDLATEVPRALLKTLLYRLDVLLSREKHQNVAGKRLRDVDLQRRHDAGLDVVVLGSLQVVRRDVEATTLDLGKKRREDPRSESARRQSTD